MNYIDALLAMAPAPGGSGGAQNSPGMMIGWLVLMLAIFYFLMIRPQRQREKERRTLLDAVKSGDRVVFSGGILGSITNVKDKTLMVKIADNVKIEISRAAVSRILDKGESPDDETNK